MEGIVLPKLSKKLGADIQELYWKLDGNFPNHEANPVKTETLEDLREIVLSKKCALGAAFDGDADRVGFVDEKGEPIPGDILTALFAKAILAEQKGATILYDLRSSKSVKEVIEEAGGKAEMCKVGHASIKRQMRDTGAVFAGELSMHFYFSEFANCEASDYAMLLLIRLMLSENKPLSMIWKPLVRYSHSGEINFEVSDAKKALSLVEETYAKAAKDISHLDGVRIDLGSPGGFLCAHPIRSL
jgi:phosphomannomutase